jgi:hypothetical protein
MARVSHSGVRPFFPCFFFWRSLTNVIVRGLRTVYVEDAFWKDEFEPDLFPTQVTEMWWEPHASKSHWNPFKGDVEGMA